jgi:hypothetical protein
MAAAAGLGTVAAGGLIFLHLYTSDIAWDEAAGALAPWWLAAAAGNCFAVYLARPRPRPACLLAGVLAVGAGLFGALYANSTHAVGMSFDFGKSTAGENWYFGVSAALVVATALFLRLATPQIGSNRPRAEPSAAAAPGG